jgi:hypothetical protein
MQEDKKEMKEGRKVASVMKKVVVAVAMVAH